jgi:hypothetical protein
MNDLFEQQQDPYITQNRSSMIGSSYLKNRAGLKTGSGLEAQSSPNPKPSPDTRSGPNQKSGLKPKSGPGDRLHFGPAIVLLSLSLFLLSWGYIGHRKIGEGTALFLPEEMSQFSNWPALLAAHGSDADYRRDDDPDEAPRHYIDIDNYPEFIAAGRIPSTMDSIYMYHHPDFIRENGTLPWATEAAYDSLAACFQRGDWDKAVLVAADLGHYVGDGHMPLHLTRNYNGQFSGNNGIHSRYESTMIGDYSDRIIFQGGTAGLVEDVNGYIFDYIYRNYPYIDSILAADDYASHLAGNTWSAQYAAALWEKTGSFTIQLMRGASLALTELIYTAWTEAGRPSMYATGSPDLYFFTDPAGSAAGGVYLEQNYPNPFRESTRIRFHLEESTRVSLCVLDVSGKLVERLLDGRMPAGETSLVWQPANLPPGNYYLVLSTGHGITCKIAVHASE